MELEINIYNIIATIKLKNPEEKDLFLSMADELSKECNELSIKLGYNIDRTILLFYLLLDIKLKRFGSVIINPTNILFEILLSISKYLVEKDKTNQSVEEKMENINRIRKILINLILIEKKNLINNSESEDKVESIEDLILSFTNNIKNNIELLKNDLLLL